MEEFNEEEARAHATIYIHLRGQSNTNDKPQSHNPGYLKQPKTFPELY